MVYVKTSEKEDKGIYVTPLSHKIIDNIDILNNLLTPLELWIIDTLKTPMTVKEIRDRYIIKRYNEEGIGWEEITKDIKPKRKIVLTAEFLEKLKLKVSIPKTAREAEKVLKKKRIRVPSYEKFDGILLSLEKLGITARRYDFLKKGKWLWILNPSFLIAKKKKH